MKLDAQFVAGNLEHIVIPLVVVGHLGLQVTGGHLVQHTADITQRDDNAFDGIIQTLDNRLPDAFIAGSVNASIKLACGGRIRHRRGAVNQAVQRHDQGVQVVLDLVEVALVVVGDLFGDVALAHAIDILGHQVERRGKGVDQIVDALKHHFVLAVKLLNSGSFVKLAVCGSLHQALNFFKNSGTA